MTPTPLPASSEAPVSLPLPPCAIRTAQVRCGQYLVCALEGAAVPLGWFDLEALAPHWHHVLPHASHGRPFPIRALLAMGDDFISISDEAIWRYRWPAGGKAFELIQRAQVPLVVGRHLAMAAITPRHLALLSRRCSKVRNGSQKLPGFLHGGLHHRLQTELLLLLDTSTLQELGSAAIEQAWDPSAEEEPSPTWEKLELDETHLRVDWGGLGTVQIELGEGPVSDLQDWLAASHQVQRRGSSIQ